MPDVDAVLRAAPSGLSLPSQDPSPNQASSSTPGPNVESSEHRLRKYDITMHTFRSRGPPININDFEIPDIAEAKPYDIYVYLFTESSSGYFMWYRDADGKKWKHAALETMHPLYSEYRLWLANDDWARWLLEKTVTTYKGRKVCVNTLVYPALESLICYLGS